MINLNKITEATLVIKSKSISTEAATTLQHQTTETTSAKVCMLLRFHFQDMLRLC